MSKLGLGLLAAVVLVALSLLVPALGPVVGFLEKVGAVTIVFWAGLDALKKGGTTTT